MLESLNNHTSIHSILSFNYLNMHQVLCACACATSRLECKEAYQPCAQLASVKKRSLWYVRPKIHMESHSVRHGGWRDCFSILMCTLWNLTCTIWHWATQVSRDLEYQVLAGCEYCLNPACLDLKYVEDHVPCNVGWRRCHRAHSEMCPQGTSKGYATPSVA